MAKLVENYRVNIDAKPEDVFSYLSDLTQHGEWNEKLRIEASSDGPAAVGSQYRSTGRMMGKEIQNDVRITELESPTRLSFISNDGKNDFLQEFTLQPMSGGTGLERRLTTEMNPIMKLMFKAVIGPMVATPSMNKSLKALKGKLEQSTS